MIPPDPLGRVHPCLSAPQAFQGLWHHHCGLYLFSSYVNTSRDGLRIHWTLYRLILTNYIFNDPIFHKAILKCWMLGLQPMFWGTKFNPVKGRKKEKS